MTADHRNDQASFTMTIDVGVTIADRVRTLIENIELFPHMGLTAVNRDSNNNEHILLYISGSVANVAEYWENWKDYEVIVYFDNMRTTDKIDASIMGTVRGNKVHGDLRINVLAIDIIKR